LVKYHPDTRFLTDYAAGSLPESQALCVAAHLHYCHSCRKHISELTELGTELFMTQVPDNVNSDSFTVLMEKLDAPQPESQPNTIDTDQVTSNLVERDALPNLGKSLRYSTIQTSDSHRESSLLEIKAGGEIPNHHHSGDEITVVLKGSFSDQEDRYHVGDYIVRTSGETHTPVASQDEDCLCLATLDAPIIMNNWIYRLLTPFINKPTVTG
jgi:putative transcriptional regulator